MSEQTTSTDIPSEDIDLLALIERSLLFFRRYRWVFIIAIIAGLGMGFLTWRGMPTVYKSRLVVHSYTLSNLDYIQIVSSWNNLLRGGDKNLLASSLGMSRQSLGKVKEIKGAEIQRVFSPNNPNGFYIDVFVTDNAVLDELQEGILYGLENTDFTKKQLAIKRENLNILITAATLEIAKLDSVKSKVEAMIGKGNVNSGNLIIDISGLSRQRIELNEKLLSFKQDLKFASAVQVLQSFSKFNSPAGPNRLVWLGLGFIAGLSLASIYTVIHSIMSKLKARSLQTKRK